MLIVTLTLFLFVAFRPAPKSIFAGALLMFVMLTEMLPYQSAVSFVPNLLEFVLLFGAYVVFSVLCVFWRSVSLDAPLPSR